ncbi:MAG TPA: 16S rRNA (adenine(1518)-N(6)/adenine(1519)-N(6))-dimethyltransferase RsmA [Trueperaceae bacterium]|nr:16S rRNA (adenine(1518)-N(6)/adenine(1519)-N(6))-dimethyltransferase RsmA [Trueperaceae bacterium]
MSPSAGKGDGAEQNRLTARGRVKSLLDKYSLHATKGFGQNFLVDEAALNAVVTAAAIEPDDTVFEVGPGLGVLTRELAARAAKVVSVELDSALLPLLDETLAGLENVELVNGDALTFDLTTLPSGSLLVANLPFNVATPVIARALESLRFERLVFLVQREVAERLVAAPGTPPFGALSLLVAHFASGRIVRDVPPGAFMPPPKVTSSVVRLDVHESARPRPELFALIRRSFAHRRKTLKRNLAYAGYPPEMVNAAMAGAGLDDRVRAETLDLATFARLLDALAEDA